MDTILYSKLLEFIELNRDIGDSDIFSYTIYTKNNTSVVVEFNNGAKTRVIFDGHQNKWRFADDGYSSITE